MYDDFNEEEYFTQHPELEPSNISCEELKQQMEDERWY